MEETADDALRWATALYGERTKKIKAGEKVPVDWIPENARVVWSEIVAEFPELAVDPVGGRWAYYEARVRAGLE